MVADSLAVVPIVRAENGRALTNSRDVADYYEKQHGHVIRSINELIEHEPTLGRSNFGATSYLDESNRQSRSYDMDRTGFVLLAMGFTGPKALQFKLAYIRAFDEMEERLTSKVPGTYDELIGVVRELVAPISVRFDYQDQTIHRVERKVDVLGDDVKVIKLELGERRSHPKKEAKSEILYTINKLGGFCPCGCGQRIMAEGILVNAELDHFYGRNKSRVNEIWYIHKTCHAELTSERVPRVQRAPQFEAFQNNRIRLQRQPSLF